MRSSAGDDDDSNNNGSRDREDSSLRRHVCSCQTAVQDGHRGYPAIWQNKQPEQAPSSRSTENNISDAAESAAQKSNGDKPESDGSCMPGASSSLNGGASSQRCVSDKSDSDLEQNSDVNNTTSLISEYEYWLSSKWFRDLFRTDLQQYCDMNNISLISEYVERDLPTTQLLKDLFDAKTDASMHPRRSPKVTDNDRAILHFPSMSGHVLKLSESTLLGIGKYTQVFKLQNGREWRALKIIQVHKSDREYMSPSEAKHEYDIMRKLENPSSTAETPTPHPSILRAFDYCERYTTPSEDSGCVLLLCELAQGNCLKNRIKHFGRMNESAAARKLFKQIVDGFVYLHKNKFYHGDVNSDNIFLDKDDNAKIGDFGKAWDSRQIIDYRWPNSFWGHCVKKWLPHLMPNIVTGMEGDVWCLGIVLCEMVLGGAPFERTTRDDGTPNYAFELPGFVSPAFRELVERILVTPGTPLLIEDVEKSEWLTLPDGSEKLRGIDTYRRTPLPAYSGAKLTGASYLNCYQYKKFVTGGFCEFLVGQFGADRKADEKAPPTPPATDSDMSSTCAEESEASSTSLNTSNSHSTAADEGTVVVPNEPAASDMLVDNTCAPIIDSEQIVPAPPELAPAKKVKKVGVARRLIRTAVNGVLRAFCMRRKRSSDRNLAESST